MTFHGRPLQQMVGRGKIGAINFVYLLQFTPKVEQKAKASIEL